MACSIVTFKRTLVTVNKKVVLVHRTPREAKTVYPSDWMWKFIKSLSHPVKYTKKRIWSRWFHTPGPL